MRFIADLHIHSRFSRATSKALTPRHLAAWAQAKGIQVLGTGDFTHPAWRAELAEQLERDEDSGLYHLKGQPEELDCLVGRDTGLPGAVRPLFLWQTEISSIYKRHGKVRKIHNLVFVPTLEDAQRLSQRLAAVGNLQADGRPILGLDSRDLFAMLLDCVPEAVLIPAHVWTPWFSLFGSRSGFDSLEECYGDLAAQIFALETGLSSDPEMNRLVSSLDSLALVSNSDAHSGANLGREANLFMGQPSFDGIFAALRSAARRQAQDGLACRFLGTMEFYPDEGKYHLDGHRACKVVLQPREALELGNICPVCGKPLTVGVLHRVLELADRLEAPQLLREPQARYLIPLAEVTAEILGVGLASRKVQEQYARLLRELGSELDILCHLPEADIRACWEPLGEAVARMRAGQVWRKGGYDGEYGSVRVFAPDELAQMAGLVLPGLRAPRTRRTPKKDVVRPGSSTAGTTALPLARTQEPSASTGQAPRASAAFSAEQQQALDSGPDPVLIVAGPGAGKTRVLVGRLQRLVREGLEPSRLLAVTFTRRAAGEIRERLALAFPGRAAGALPQCDTLHGLAWRWLCASSTKPPLLLGEETAENLFCLSNPQLASAEARRLWKAYAKTREQGLPNQAADNDLALAAANYTARKKSDGLIRMDYADLLDWLLARAAALEEGQRPLHLLVDEVQDLSPLQLRIVRTLLPAHGHGFFGIGDPDQAIYGFRGVSGQSEASLRACWPNLITLRLGRSYRASQKVLDMAHSLLGNQGQAGSLVAARPLSAQLRFFSAPDAQAEARWVAQRVGELLGATSHTLLDHSTGPLVGSLAPGDIAVLVRLKAQIPLLRDWLEKTGIPCAAPVEESFLQDRTCGRLLTLLAAHSSGPHRGTFADARDAALELTCGPTDGGLPALCGLQAWLQAQDWAGEEFLAGRAWRDFCTLWQECASWTQLFQRIAWMREEEAVCAKAERVQLLTLHASKGLEFQAVFIPGLEDGLLPLRRSALFGPKQAGKRSEECLNGAEESEEEETRLLYVGLTRAARALFLSTCARRTLFGRQLTLRPSPLLSRIEGFCQHCTTKRESRQMSLFRL